MTENQIPQWLKWAREIQSLAQIGLTYSKSEYDKKHNRRLLEIAAEIVQTHTTASDESLMDDFLSQPGYATPKVDIRGAAIRDGKILLVQERADLRWCMPGGWADVGETPVEATVREVREESGFTVSPQKLIGVFDANRGGKPLSFFHAYKMVFLCEIVEGKPATNHETIAVDFFSFDNLPPFSPHRTHTRQIEEVQKHIQDKNRLTSFE